MLLMRNKSQAFLELQDVDSAKTMINYYTYVSPTVRNTPVSFAYFCLRKVLVSTETT